MELETLILDCRKGARKESLLTDLLAILDDDGRSGFLNDLSQLDLEGRYFEDIAYRDGALMIDGATESQSKGRRNGHEHHSLDEVLGCIGSLNASDKVKADAFGIYGILSQGEAKAHGVDVENVHFHEVGNIYAIVTIVSICMIVERLGVEGIVATPITTGFGYVDCAHGRLPIPAPATANILEGLPSVAGDAEGELATPTGVAIVRHFADGFTD